MDNERRFGVFSSSADPAKLSMTVEGFGKMVGGIITFLAVLNGVDPLIAGQEWSNFVTAIVTAAPAAYAAWHAGEMVFGAMRKLFLLFFPPKPTA